MEVSERLIAMLRCPETQQPLRLANADDLERIRTATDESVKSAIIRADGNLAYPIRDGFPILLTKEGIHLDSEK